MWAKAQRTPRDQNYHCWRGRIMTKNWSKTIQIDRATKEEALKDALDEIKRINLLQVQLGELHV